MVDLGVSSSCSAVWFCSKLLSNRVLFDSVVYGWSYLQDISSQPIISISVESRKSHQEHKDEPPRRTKTQKEETLSDFNMEI